jgi:hypothetical protein
MKDRLRQWYADERLAFALGPWSYVRAIPGRLKDWAWRGLGQLVVGVLLASLVSCAL